MEASKEGSRDLEAAIQAVEEEAAVSCKKQHLLKQPLPPLKDSGSW